MPYAILLTKFVNSNENSEKLYIVCKTLARSTGEVYMICPYKPLNQMSGYPIDISLEN